MGKVLQFPGPLMLTNADPCWTQPATAEEILRDIEALTYRMRSEIVRERRKSFRVVR